MNTEAVTEWGTLMPGGNVCMWETEDKARRAAIISKTFPDGEHPLVKRECTAWEKA